MKFIMKIKPSIAPEIRHKIEDLLKKEGFDVSGGGQSLLLENSYSEITFQDKILSDSNLSILKKEDIAMDIEKRLKHGTIHFIGTMNDSSFIAEKLNRTTRGILPFRRIVNLKGVDVPLLIWWDKTPDIITSKQIEDIINLIVIRDGVILDSDFNDITESTVVNYRECPESKIIEKLLLKFNDLSKFIKIYKSVDIELQPISKRFGPDKNEFFVYLHLEVDNTNTLCGYVGMFSEIVFNYKGEFISQSFYDGSGDDSLSTC